MTQNELADALDLHQSQISRYVRRGMPMDLQGARNWIRQNIRLTMKPMPKRPPQPDPREVAEKLGAVAEQWLQAGQPLDDLEPALRRALRAIPPDERDPLPYSFAIMDVLVRPSLAVLDASMTPEEREENAAACKRRTEAELFADGCYWTQIAAGEIELHLPVKVDAAP